MWVNGNGVTLGSPVHGYPAVPGASARENRGRTGAVELRRDTT